MKVKLYQIAKSKKLVQSDRKDHRIHYHSKTPSNRQRLYVSDTDDLNDVAVIDGHNFKDIFDRRDGDYGNSKRVIKISNGSRSIYRQYHCSGDIHGISRFVGLSYQSIRELCGTADAINTLDSVEVSKGSPINYYLTHITIGNVVSFVFTILGIVVSIILFFLS